MARSDVVPGGRAGKAMAAAAAAAGGGGGSSVSLQDADKKSHRAARSGPAAERKKEKDKKKRGVDDDAEERENPRAFAFRSSRRAKLQVARRVELQQRRMHAPSAAATRAQALEPPPFVVLVQGPPKVGKTTLIRSLIKHYTKHNIPDVKGPITVVSGKKRRLLFIECSSSVHAMLDAAKFADLVLLLIDGSFGFEMETFEFLNMLQVHGFPKVMGVLTHLDGFRDPRKLKKTKKTLKHRFWTEIYDGAKLFYLSGLIHGRCPKRELLNLARFISVAKFRPLSW
ncbi:unnamed protein product [Closterium sp. NIES-65]|nr:unnamed protein product [Closterium sp. NIES-65]